MVNELGISACEMGFDKLDKICEVGIRFGFLNGVRSVLNCYVVPIVGGDCVDVSLLQGISANGFCYTVYSYRAACGALDTRHAIVFCGGVIVLKCIVNIPPMVIDIASAVHNGADNYLVVACAEEYMSKIGDGIVGIAVAKGKKLDGFDFRNGDNRGVFDSGSYCGTNYIRVLCKLGDFKR